MQFNIHKWKTFWLKSQQFVLNYSNDNAFYFKWNEEEKKSNYTATTKNVRIKVKLLEIAGKSPPPIELIDEIMALLVKSTEKCSEATINSTSLYKQSSFWRYDDDDVNDDANCFLIISQYKQQTRKYFNYSNINTQEQWWPNTKINSPKAFDAREHDAHTKPLRQRAYFPVLRPMNEIRQVKFLIKVPLYALYECFSLSKSLPLFHTFSPYSW